MAIIKKLTSEPVWSRKRKNAKYDVRSLEPGMIMTLSVDEIGCKDIKSFRAYLWHRSRQLGYDMKCRQLEDGKIEVYRRA